MLRVLATIKQSPFAGQMSSQQTDLGNWVTEIVGAVSSRVDPEGLVHNYITNTSTFTDTASSALLAYSAFRLSTLGITSSYTGFANQVHSTIVGKYISGNGTLLHATDPLVWDRIGTTGSPEGQSFVVLMQAAYSDYRGGGGGDNTTTVNSAMGLRVGGGMGWEGLMMIVGMGVVAGLI